MFVPEHTSKFPPRLHKPRLASSVGTQTRSASIRNLPKAGCRKAGSSSRCTMQYFASVRWYSHRVSQLFQYAKILWVPTNVLSHKMGFLQLYPLFIALVNFLFQIWKLHFLHRNKTFCYHAWLSAHSHYITNILCEFAFPASSVWSPFSHQVLTMKGNSA